MLTVKFTFSFLFLFLIVVEWGDDVKAVSEDEAMVLVNHQATGDVCTLMMCLQDKGTVGYTRGVGWLLCVRCSLRSACIRVWP